MVLHIKITEIIPVVPDDDIISVLVQYILIGLEANKFVVRKCSMISLGICLGIKRVLKSQIAIGDEEK